MSKPAGGHMNVEEEVAQLAKEIMRLGQKQPDGSYNVAFGPPTDECLRHHSLTDH